MTKNQVTSFRANEKKQKVRDGFPPPGLLAGKRASLENSRWSVKIMSLLFDFDKLSRMTRPFFSSNPRVGADVTRAAEYKNAAELRRMIEKNPLKNTVA